MFACGGSWRGLVAQFRRRIAPRGLCRLTVLLLCRRVADRKAAGRTPPWLVRWIWSIALGHRGFEVVAFFAHPQVEVIEGDGDQLDGRIEKRHDGSNRPADELLQNQIALSNDDREERNYKSRASRNGGAQY